MDPDERPRARPATPDDYDDFTRLYQELATGDPIPSKDRYEALFMARTLFLQWRGKPVAYAYATALGASSHVGQVVVDPGCRGEGVGRVLMEAIADRLRTAGCSRWGLSVKVGNTPALRLYARFGLEPDYASTALRFPWKALASVGRDPSAVCARLLQPAEDSAFEAALRVTPGQIADNRGRAGRLLIGAVDVATGAERLGVASFDPAFPGAHPFRAANERAAGALLEAMRAHALPEHDFVFITVEDNADLTRALVAAGATVRFEMLHLAGPIPV